VGVIALDGIRRGAVHRSARMLTGSSFRALRVAR
jgi:hypothetical protein